MDDSFFDWDDFDEYKEFRDLLDKYEKSLESGSPVFLDLDEFEEIIDYYLATNQHQKAQGAIELALQFYPGSSGVILLQARSFLEAHKPQKALEIINQYEPNFQPDAEWFLVKGDIYNQLQQHEKAIQCYKKSLELITDTDKYFESDVYLRIAYLYQKIDNYVKAIEYFKRVLDVMPEDEITLYEVAHCYNMMDDDDGGIEFLKNFLSRNIYSATAFVLLGEFFHNKGLYEKALDAYEYAIAINKDYAQAYINKAETYIELEQYEDALETLEEYKAGKTLIDEHARYLYGIALARTGQHKRAMNVFRNLIKNDPFNAEVWYEMAYLAFETSDYHSARHYIRKAIDLDDEDAEYYWLAGMIANKLLMFEEARVFYIQALNGDESVRKKAFLALLYNMLQFDVEIYELNLPLPGHSGLEIELPDIFALTSAHDRSAEDWAMFFLKQLPELKKVDQLAFQIALEKLISLAINYFYGRNKNCAYDIIEQLVKNHKQETISCLQEEFAEFVKSDLHLQKILES